MRRDLSMVTQQSGGGGQEQSGACPRDLGEHSYPLPRASLVAQRVKRLPTRQTPGFDPWVGKIHWRRKWQPTPVLMPGKSYGRRSLVGYSPRGRKESDTTEQPHFHFFFTPCPPSSVTRWRTQAAPRGTSTRVDQK